MYKWVLLALLFHSSWGITYAQSNLEKCGDKYVRNKLNKQFPLIGINKMARQANKTAIDTATYTIPVVFHIVLNQTQINTLGEEDGLRAYIDSQIIYSNQDFNGLNADSTLIPAVFKPLFGHAKINFALAHTSPSGSATDGYEIVLTTARGFNIDGTHGSGIAFSDVKYATTGGADAWDPDKYVNIWVTDLLEDGKPSNFLGITLSAATVKGSTIPKEEIGVVINYHAWYKGFKGRTLTHELGHVFSLMHTWGDDDGLCPDNGGFDDGIADTPPQANYTFGCPSFPLFDACSTSGNGIMFMNYMDYTDEVCQYLFTIGQVEVMRSDLLSSGICYSLTQHPDLLQLPSQTGENTFSIYPNPAHGKINIRFKQTSTSLQRVSMTNICGQTIFNQSVTDQNSFYSFNLSSLGKGIYFMHLEFAEKTVVEKIVVY